MRNNHFSQSIALTVRCGGSFFAVSFFEKIFSLLLIADYRIDGHIMSKKVFLLTVGLAKKYILLYNKSNK